MARTQADPFVDEKAEEAVLGSVLNSPSRVQELEDLQPEHLAGTTTQLVLWAIRMLEKQGASINGLSVAQVLKHHGKLVAAGGPQALMALDAVADELLGVSPLGDQVALLKDLAARRNARARLRAEAEALLDMRRPASAVLLEAAGRLTELGSQGGTTVPTAAEVMQRSLERIDDTQAGRRGEKYIRTGVRVWDEYFGGLPRRRVTVVAAHPGVGKSSLINTMALALAEGDESLGRKPERLFYGHLEDEAESFTDRHLAEHSGLSLRELGSAGLSREQLQSVADAAAHLNPALERIRIDGKRGMDVKQLVGRARHYVRNEGVRVVLVDHALQLIQDPTKLGEKVFVVMNTLADFSHDEDVAVVVALHLTDPEDKKVDARYVRPTIQMMAGGRTVERVARIIAGMRLCPTPRKPDFTRAPQKQPKGKALDADTLARWQAEQQTQEAKYHREVAEWERRKALAENRVLLSSVKANEGRTGFEFWLERVPHAALFNRREGGAREGEVGYSPGPASR